MSGSSGAPSSAGSVVYRRVSSSSSTSGVADGSLSAGVRGGGAVTMERTEEEKQKYPDRINLDRKGLHGIPILEAEPGLRFLSLQHNFIKRIQHLNSTHKLVFLDLYHNRLDLISNLESLVNLRVLMLGKNRIRRVEGLQHCLKLSVLDLHGNRITQVTGLDNLSELKVLNLAGNLIRKISNLQGLTSLEELNMRRNRIRCTQGLEAVPTLEKLYLSNNEIQGISSLQKLDRLVRLHTVQMEGNPVWSITEYAYHLVTSLPELKVLDQQEVSTEVRTNAKMWKEAQTPPGVASAAAGSGAGGGGAAGGARKQLLKKMEERNVSISNAKQRWNFLKRQDWKSGAQNALAAANKATGDAPTAAATSLAGSPQSSTAPPHPPTPPRFFNDGEEQSDNNSSPVPTTTTEETESVLTLSPSLSNPQLNSLSRQASRTNLLLQAKLNIPGGSIDRCKSTPGSPTHVRRGLQRSDDSGSRRHHHHHHHTVALPPIPIKSQVIRRRFPGLERRKFALPNQRFVCLQRSSSDSAAATVASDLALHGVSGTLAGMAAATSSSAPHHGGSGKQSSFANLDKKIGFFHLPGSVGVGGSGGDEHGHCAGDDFHGMGGGGGGGSGVGGMISTSSDSSDESSDDDEDERVYRQKSTLASRARENERMRRNLSTPKLRHLDPASASGGATAAPGTLSTSVSSAHLLRPSSGVPQSRPSGLSPVQPTASSYSGGLKHSASATTLNVMAAAAAAQDAAGGGRTSEQGRDFLIELDGDLLSVYGLQALKFLDRPWNKTRAVKATTVQFNFVSFDDLIPYLPKFRQTFPNVDSFEFLETDIRTFNQLNALALVQGITSLFIGDDGNPIYHKNWRPYAIYRLEHWGLQYVNNSEVTDEEILEANRAYGSLGELAVLVMPQTHLANIARKLDLLPPPATNAAQYQDPYSVPDFMSSVRDPNLKEVIAKETLTYKPNEVVSQEQQTKNIKALESMIDVVHSAFHKFGRLEDEWTFILPILVKRIVSQYSDLGQYKRESLGKFEKRSNTLDL